jgi:DNA-binding NarL/FixJ family response regulator
MQKPDPYFVRAARHPLESEPADTQSIRRESPNIISHPPGRPDKLSDRRLLLISPPGLVSDCLNNALKEGGYDTVLRPLGDALQIQDENVDLVVLSLSSVEPDGLTALRYRASEIRASLPGVPAMALIEHCSPDVPRELAELGLVAIVQGYLSVKLALAAINLVMVGGSLMTTKICLQTDQAEAPRRNDAAGTAEATDDMDFSAVGNFTKREIALLTRLRQGMQNKAIAYELGIAESTVKVHLRNIMSKLHASNRTQVAYMLANGSLATSQKMTLDRLESIAMTGNVAELFPAPADKSAKTVSTTRLES